MLADDPLPWVKPRNTPQKAFHADQNATACSNAKSAVADREHQRQTRDQECEPIASSEARGFDQECRRTAFGAWRKRSPVRELKEDDAQGPDAEEGQVAEEGALRRRTPSVPIVVDPMKKKVDEGKALIIDHIAERYKNAHKAFQFLDLNNSGKVSLAELEQISRCGACQSPARC